MKNWLYSFMNGRYGNDKLNTHLLILSVILSVINIFTANTYLYVFIYILLIYILFRMLSRNVAKRYKEEQRYEHFLAPLTRRKTIIKRRSKDKDHRYYVCPSCKQIVRVPKGKGQIDIRCPRCGHIFTKRT